MTSTFARLADAYEDSLEAYNRTRAANRRSRQPAHASHKPRCGECGLHIRGPNHKEGADHLRRKSARAGKAA